MWLVLCEPEDEAAGWAADGLRARGLDPLEVVAPRALIRSGGCTHELGRGGATFTIGLPDGRTVASDAVRGVLNRAMSVGAPASAGSDGAYIAAELHALMLSLLGCLGPRALNRPSGYELAGAWRSVAEWSVLATRAGLRVPVLPPAALAVPMPKDCTATLSVLVLDGSCYGDELGPEDAAACVRLAALASTDLLGITLHRDAEAKGWFGAATPLPELRLGGSVFLDALHSHFVGPGSWSR